ncbi:hypothetical protein NW768_011161 [Fusarium equiseti]|uniref:Protein kinase domain-containing protein n=1 Tax=Fusarium equiseti TaxID=61235 RepID=A0ABQ8QYJ5_FUSEQ|nr:hypothetical protein NW768_011161 [Fusarium equiseti]
MSNQLEPEFLDDIAIYQLRGGHGEGAEIRFKFNNKQICVSIFPSNGSSTMDTQHLGPGERPLQDHLVDVIDRSMTTDRDQYERLVNEVLDVILDVGRPLFSGPRSTVQDDDSLHPLLFPHVLYFRLDASFQTASLIPIDVSEGYSVEHSVDEDFEEGLKLRKDVPRFAPDEIKITHLLGQGANSVTAVVQVGGRKMFCKACGAGLNDSGQGREFPCMNEILNAFPDPSSIQVPQLLGYIHHQDTKQILGFVREWIPGHRLDDVDITPEKGQKWIVQISQTIERLHEHGIVWGDGKPNNIVIDEKDDAWLIDFGGGTTEGWVDGELSETIEGDNQALRRIIKFLSDGDGQSSLLH